MNICGRRSAGKNIATIVFLILFIIFGAISVLSKKENELIVFLMICSAVCFVIFISLVSTGWNDPFTVGGRGLSGESMSSKGSGKCVCRIRECLDNFEHVCARHESKRACKRGELLSYVSDDHPNGIAIKDLCKWETYHGDPTYGIPEEEEEEELPKRWPDIPASGRQPRGDERPVSEHVHRVETHRRG